jgi:hypothetical protein
LLNTFIAFQTVVLAGDFRQVLPVVKFGSRAQIVDSTIKRSNLWRHFLTSCFERNMRVENATTDAESVKQFDAWLLSIGNGTAPTITDDMIELPPAMTITFNGKLSQVCCEFTC